MAAQDLHEGTKVKIVTLAHTGTSRRRASLLAFAAALCTVLVWSLVNGALSATAQFGPPGTYSTLTPPTATATARRTPTKTPTPSPTPVVIAVGASAPGVPPSGPVGGAAPPVTAQKPSSAQQPAAAQKPAVVSQAAPVRVAPVVVALPSTGAGGVQGTQQGQSAALLFGVIAAVASLAGAGCWLMRAGRHGRRVYPGR
jgi:hypothetical protein